MSLLVFNPNIAKLLNLTFVRGTQYKTDGQTDGRMKKHFSILELPSHLQTRQYSNLKEKVICIRIFLNKFAIGHLEHHLKFWTFQLDLLLKGDT